LGGSDGFYRRLRADWGEHRGLQYAVRGAEFTSTGVAILGDDSIFEVMIILAVRWLIVVVHIYLYKDLSQLYSYCFQ